MHQHPPQAPLGPNNRSTTGQSPDVSGRVTMGGVGAEDFGVGTDFNLADFMAVIVSGAQRTATLVRCVCGIESPWWLDIRRSTL